MIKTVLPTPLQKLRAFTLLELSVSLAIIGLMMSGVMVMMSNIVQTQAEAAAATDMREIADALKAYRIRNGHLPCPASYTTVYGSAEYGRQVNSGDCTYTVAPAGTTRVETAASSGIWVLTGAVPVRDLLLRDTFLKDQYGDRITYSVAQLLTASGTYDDNDGVITIKDSGGNDAITEGAYVLISHGKDGKGAYREGTGSLKVACGATANVDVENCNGDTVFIDAMFNDGQVVASYYDDTLIWKTKWDLIDPNAIQEEVVVGPDFTGFRVDGVAANDNAGFSVGSGDVNGDGFDDVIIGARNSNAGAGYTYVVFGKAQGITTPLDIASLDGTNGFRLDGTAAGDYSGQAVSSGDINNDGFDDVIIGAIQADPGGIASSGSTYVVFGKATGWAATISLSSLSGTNGFRLDGTAAGDYSGNSISSGDVNGDGFDDVIIGANYAYGQRGYIYVVFGKSGAWAATIALSTLNGTNGSRLNGTAVGDVAGWSVSKGDVNNDGLDDLIIGASGVSSSSGSTYVLFGKAGAWAATIALSSLDGTTGFRLDGIAGSYSGRAVSSGDINNDGFDDVIIGAHAANGSAGYSYVVFGKSGAWTVTTALSSLDGTTGFRLDGAVGEISGTSVSSGDVNGDGFDDIIIGAHYANSQAGSTYVVFGKSGAWTATTAIATLNGTTGFRLNGTTASDRSGQAVSSGDITGDGTADVIIGAFYATSQKGYTCGVYGHSGAWSATYDLNTITVP